MPRRSFSAGGLVVRCWSFCSGYGSVNHPQGLMQEFWYVYILQSEMEEDHFYVGLTEDLKTRLSKHNAGEVPHTSKFRPWRLKTAIAFNDKQRASAFERYLKSGSGRAFAKNHL
jgi:putative endonuclease